MKRRSLLPALSPIALFTAAALVLGCADVPKRPVPPPEAQNKPPPWFPEDPWNKRTGPQKAFFFGKVVFQTAIPRRFNVEDPRWYNKYLRGESVRTLTQLLCWLQANPDITRIRLEGHTDSRATDEYNQALAERRVMAVADWLVDHGLDHNRIVAVAFGETRPLATNDNGTGMQENRRTEFHVAELQGYWFQGREPANGGLVLTVLSKAEREAAARKSEPPPPYRSPPVFPERDIFHEYERTNPAIIKDKILRGEEEERISSNPEEGAVPASLDPGAAAFDPSICAGVGPIIPQPLLYPHYPEVPK